MLVVTAKSPLAFTLFFGYDSSALTTTDLTDYLTQGTITTTVGIFLGMAANKRGSCDPSVSKMLCLHIPSLLPHSFTPMDIASPVQAAAVAGIGLLYQGSAHRLMTEFLIKEISQPMKEHNANDKESFALVCGLALGMVRVLLSVTVLTIFKYHMFLCLSIPGELAKRYLHTKWFRRLTDRRTLTALHIWINE